MYGVGWTRATIEPYLEYVPPVAEEKWNPCTDRGNHSNTEVQQELSCLARSIEIYVVANTGARQPCPSTDPRCPPDGHYQHSTNVVYAPNGDFIARYFKYNLNADETYLDKPNRAENITFTTPFGRFGTMTTDDILFHDPIVNLVKYFNITNIVYPNAWRNDLPLYSTIEFHSAFAEGMLINLLSANLHLPSMGFYGSGLYWPTGTSINASYTNDANSESGGSLVVETMTPFIVKDDSQLEIKNKNEHRTRSKRETVHLNKDFGNDNGRNVKITINHDVYDATLLRGSSGGPTVCMNTLCCSADYEGQFPSSELYALGAFDGMHTVGNKYYLQACVFIKCANNSKESCGKPTTTATSYMSKMSFVGNFSTPFVFPEVLTDQGGNTPGLVTSIWYYQESVIIDAGLYGGPLSISMIGRDYSRDP